MNIVAITVKYPGVERVFEEGRMLGLWKTVEIGERHQKFRFPKADVYIFGAFHHDYPKFAKFLKDSFPGCKVGYYWTSSPGEVDLVYEPEMTYLYYLINQIKAKKIDFLLFGDRNLAKVFDYPGVYYAPYPICPVERKAKEERKGISFLCPDTTKKNILNQFLAVKLLQKERPDERLYTNLQNYKPLIEWLGLNARVTGWLNHRDYIKLICSVKCGLQVSIAETNNYVVVDHFMAGVPCLVSPTIDWAFDVVNHPLGVIYANHPQIIKTQLLDAIGRYKKMGEECKKIILERAKKNNSELKQLLEEINC